MSEHGLARLRRERGLTQDDLAYRAGVSKGTIGKIETGRQRARPSTRRKLCRALRVAYVKHETVFGPLAQPGPKALAPQSAED